MTGGENGLTFSQPALALPGVGRVALHARRPSTGSCSRWSTLSYLAVRRVTRSPFGMVLQSIRENEPRTRAIGYHVERYKMVAVMLSGLFAGLAGVLYAVQNKFAAPDFVFFVVSGEVVIFNVMGGMGTLVGAVRRGRVLPAAAGGRVPVLHGVLPDPRGRPVHPDGHLPAAGAARIPPPAAEPLSAGRSEGASGAEPQPLTNPGARRRQWTVYDVPMPRGWSACGLAATRSGVAGGAR